ncbi:pyridoxine/pyridoxal/pyridoxamine kinase [Pseudoxanthomonas beigongshangi]
MNVRGTQAPALSERLGTVAHQVDVTRKPLRIDVVSVQSQVVYGSVGNAVAVPALRAHGLAVAAVPTVLLSNTPHYPTFHGGAVPLEWFSGYLSDLRARDALRQLRAVVIGYLGEPAQAATLATWLGQLRERLPDLRVFIDPVMGDVDSGVYVAPGMVEAYLRHLLPQADGITPNGFELAQLVPGSGTDLDGVIAAARRLLRGRTRWVVVTSAAPDAWEPDLMWLAVVTRDAVEVIRHPRLAADSKGTGDLFNADLAARLLAGTSLQDAVAQASGHVIEALRLTLRHRSGELLLPPSPGSSG